MPFSANSTAISCFVWTFGWEKPVSGGTDTTLADRYSSGVLHVRVPRTFGYTCGVFFLKGFGEVYEEDQAEHNELALGWVYSVDQRISSISDLILDGAV